MEVVGFLLNSTLVLGLWGEKKKRSVNARMSNTPNFYQEA
jgi:hypothetical protein